MHEYILKFIIIREFVATKKYETKRAFFIILEASIPATREITITPSDIHSGISTWWEIIIFIPTNPKIIFQPIIRFIYLVT